MNYTTKRRQFLGQNIKMEPITCAIMTWTNSTKLIHSQVTKLPFKDPSNFRFEFVSTSTQSTRHELLNIQRVHCPLLFFKTHRVVVSVCRWPMECVRGECRFVVEGDSCTQDDCGFWMTCVNGRCLELRFAGELCAGDDQCYSKTCNHGICGGRKEGERCQPSAANECGEGLYCSRSAKRCTKKKKPVTEQSTLLLNHHLRENIVLILTMKAIPTFCPYAVSSLSVTKPMVVHALRILSCLRESNRNLHTTVGRQCWRPLS